jgi:hypothetical protein
MAGRRNFKRVFEIHSTKLNLKYNLSNIWDEGRTVLKIKFMTLNACIRKELTFKIHNLSLYFRKLENEEHSIPKA